MSSCISSEYIYEKSILANAPLVPLSWQASYCRTDSRRLELIDELASEIVTRLGVHVGGVICGSTKPDVLAISAVPASERDQVKYARREQDVYDALLEDRDAEAVSEEYFRHLWDNALHELESETYLTRRDELLVPTRSIAIIPLSCRFKLAVQGLLKAMSLYIIGAVAFFGSVLWARYRFNRSRRESAKVDEVVGDVLRRLAEQQMVSLDSSEPAHLPANHLRDLLLPSSGSSSSSRKRVWASVARKVESNSNVRTGMKRWRGEWSRGWEWVGVSASGATRSGRSTPATPATPATPRSSETVIVHDTEGEASEMQDMSLQQPQLNGQKTM